MSIEELPSYAPELNPVEQLWNHIKYGVLANFAPQDVGHADEVVREHLAAARCDRKRLQGFFKASGLRWPERNL